MVYVYINVLLSSCLILSRGLFGRGWASAVRGSFHTYAQVANATKKKKNKFFAMYIANYILIVQVINNYLKFAFVVQHPHSRFFVFFFFVEIKIFIIAMRQISNDKLCFFFIVSKCSCCSLSQITNRQNEEFVLVLLSFLVCFNCF
jgi:hypothetical protein